MVADFERLGYFLRWSKKYHFWWIKFWTKSSIFNDFLIKSIGLPLYKTDNFQRFLNKIHGFIFKSNMCLNFRKCVFPLRKSATFCFDLNDKCTNCGEEGSISLQKTWQVGVLWSHFRSLNNFSSSKFQFYSDKFANHHFMNIKMTSVFT